MEGSKCGGHVLSPGKARQCADWKKLCWHPQRLDAGLGPSGQQTWGASEAQASTAATTFQFMLRVWASKRGHMFLMCCQAPQITWLSSCGATQAMHWSPLRSRAGARQPGKCWNPAEAAWLDVGSFFSGARSWGAEDTEGSHSCSLHVPHFLTLRLQIDATTCPPWGGRAGVLLEITVPGAFSKTSYFSCSGQWEFNHGISESFQCPCSYCCQLHFVSTSSSACGQRSHRAQESSPCLCPNLPCLHGEPLSALVPCRMHQGRKWNHSASIIFKYFLKYFDSHRPDQDGYKIWVIWWEEDSLSFLERRCNVSFSVIITL